MNISKFVNFIICIFFYCLSCAETKSTKNNSHNSTTATTINPNQTTNSIEVKTDNNKGDLVFIGKAVRSIFFVDIYRIELWLSHPKKFNKQKPLDSLNKIKKVAIYMKVLRSVEGKQIKKSLKLSLEKNKVNIEKESIKKFLNAFDISIKKGDVFSFKGEKTNDGKEVFKLNIPKSSQPLVISEPNIIQNIFSIWLGNTNHSKGLTDLKKQLLNKK